MDIGLGLELGWEWDSLSVHIAVGAQVGAGRDQSQRVMAVVLDQVLVQGNDVGY
jgi:hypothetical protein